jgi:hypothetical protein
MTGVRGDEVEEVEHGLTCSRARNVVSAAPYACSGGSLRDSRGRSAGVDGDRAGGFGGARCAGGGATAGTRGVTAAGWWRRHGDGRNRHGGTGRGFDGIDARPESRHLGLALGERSRRLHELRLQNPALGGHPGELLPGRFLRPAQVRELGLGGGEIGAESPERGACRTARPEQDERGRDKESEPPDRC